GTSTAPTGCTTRSWKSCRRARARDRAPASCCTPTRCLLLGTMTPASARANPAPRSWPAEVRNEPDGRAAVARPARSGTLAACRARRRGRHLFLHPDDRVDLRVRVGRAATRAAAPRGHGTGAAAGVPQQTCQGGQSRGVQTAAEGHRALLRRAAAAA